VVSPIDQFIELRSNDEDPGNGFYHWGLPSEILGNSRDSTDHGSGLVVAQENPYLTLCNSLTVKYSTMCSGENCKMF
jgi:hypothetical protein